MDQLDRSTERHRSEEGNSGGRHIVEADSLENYSLNHSKAMGRLAEGSLKHSHNLGHKGTGEPEPGQ